MTRREFIALLGPMVAWPLAARAQQAARPVVGLLGSELSELFAERMRSIHQGLSETGYVEDQNLLIEYRWAHGRNDQLPGLAADLVRRQVSVIITIGGTPAARAAKAATTAIPIVFQVGVDPIKVGLVASLNRPGGNVTGVTTLGVELGPKRLEMLHQVVPTAEVLGVLVNPTNKLVAESETRDLNAAARTIGLKLVVVHAGAEREFDAALTTLRNQRAGGLLIGNDGFLNSHAEQLAVLGIHYGLPMVHTYRTFAAAGGLMSYGGSFGEPYRNLGIYTGRILRGEKPADLPVQQSTKIEFVINLKTAKALGLEIPPTLLARADEVIE